MSSWKNHKITLSLEKSSVASAFGSDCKRLWASSSLLGVICGVGFLERRGVGDGVFSVFGPDGVLLPAGLSCPVGRTFGEAERGLEAFVEPLSLRISIFSMFGFARAFRNRRFFTWNRMNFIRTIRNKSPAATM